jgi:hypothetical protein
MSEEVEVVQEPARKQAGHLVTSENLAEFNANKLGLAQDCGRRSGARWE